MKRPSWKRVVLVSLAVTSVVAIFYPVFSDIRIPFESTGHHYERVGAMRGRHGLVEGRVVDGRGLPLPGAEVTAWGLPFKTHGSVVRRLATDAAGGYRFGGLPRGRYRIALGYDRWAEGSPREWTVAVSEDAHRAPDLVSSRSLDAAVDP